MTPIKDSAMSEVAKAAPPVWVTALATAQGWTMSDYVALATILYIGLQSAYLLWKWYQEHRKNSAG